MNSPRLDPGIPYRSMKSKTTTTTVKRVGIPVRKTITKVSSNRNAQRRQQRARATPTPRNLRRLSSSTMAAARYCTSILSGDICSDRELPCVNAMDYREVICKWTIRPTISLDGTRAIVVANPHYMWTDNIGMASAVSSTGAVTEPITLTPLYYVTGNNNLLPSFATDAEGAYAGASLTGGSSEMTLTNTNYNTGYRGESRFVGGKVTFRSFETWQNTGGQLFYCHNPQSRSLLGYQINSGTVTPALSRVVFNSTQPSYIEGSRSSVALHQVTQNPVQMSILPHTTEFEPVNAAIDPGTAGGSTSQQEAFAASAWVDQIHAIVPDNPGEFLHSGFTHAWIYKPANVKAAGADALCEFEFEMHYHVNVNLSTAQSIATWQMSQANAVNISGVSDAKLASGMQSAISGIKQARVTNPNVAFKTPELPNAVLSHPSSASTVLSTIAKAAPQVADAIADLLPPGVPKLFLEGASRAVKLFLG